MTAEPVGFVGLGNMGHVLAADLAQSGHRVVAHDAAGPSRAPSGVEHAPSVPDVARPVEVLNKASGQSAATNDKFPNHVLS